MSQSQATRRTAMTPPLVAKPFEEREHSHTRSPPSGGPYRCSGPTFRPACRRASRLDYDRQALGLQSSTPTQRRRIAKRRHVHAPQSLDRGTCVTGLECRSEQAVRAGLVGIVPGDARIEVKACHGHMTMEPCHWDMTMAVQEQPCHVDMAVQWQPHHGREPNRIRLWQTRRMRARTNASMAVAMQEVPAPPHSQVQGICWGVLARTFAGPKTRSRWIWGRILWSL